MDSKTGEELARLLHDEPVSEVTIEPGGDYLAAVIGAAVVGPEVTPREAQVWRLPTKATVARLPLYNQGLSELVFDSSGQWLAMADGKQIVRLIDPRSAQPEVLQIHHQVWPSSMALSPDGKRLATVEYTQLEMRGSSEESLQRLKKVWEGIYKDKKEGESKGEGKTRIWDLATGKVIATLPHEGGVYQIAFSPDGTYVVTGGADHTARLWNATTGIQVNQLKHEQNVSSVKFSSDGFAVATRTTDGAAQIWDVGSTKSITVAKDGYVNELAFSPDSKRLATAEGDVFAEKDGEGSATMWVFGAGNQDQGSSGDKIEADKPSRPPLQPSKKILGVRLWDVATGENSVFLPHRKPVENILFSPDGTLIASDMFLQRTDAVQLWNAKTGRRIASLQASPEGKGISVKAFSPDGKYLAAKTDNEVLIWEVGTRQEMTRLMHDDGVGDVIFNADGRFLAASHGDKISIWDWKRGREIAWLRHGGMVTKIAFTPDDSRLVSASDDSMVRVWAWQKEDLVADACSRLEWNLSPDEWRKYLGDKPQACPSLPVPEK